MSMINTVIKLEWIDYLAFVFEIIQRDDSLVWLHQYWGNVKFDDIIIEEMRFSEL